jgi:fluoride exporter
MKTFLLVGIGGFAGSYLRYLTSFYIGQKMLSSFPFGTFIVNILGCFLVGILFGLSSRFNLAPEYRLLLATGFCGGFTTFSSFSYEGIMLIQDAQFLYGFLYAGLSLIIGFFAAWLGLFLIRSL